MKNRNNPEKNDLENSDNSLSNENAVEEPKVSLRTYTNTLPTDGIHKFAYGRIEAKLMEWKLPMEDRTISEWEGLYLKAQSE